MVKVTSGKARAFVYSMAAEKLTAAMLGVASREVRRAMLAWQTVVRAERTAQNIHKYIRFQGIRQVAHGLGLLLLKAESKKFVGELKKYFYLQYA